MESDGHNHKSHGTLGTIHGSAQMSDGKQMNFLQKKVNHNQSKAGALSLHIRYERWVSGMRYKLKNETI